MSSNKKKIPVPDPEKEEYKCPAASWGDMTGLIPYTAEKGSERSSCGGMFPYLPEYGGKKE